VSLTLPAKPESVALARREAAELGARLNLTQRQIDDLKTLVSEACTNAAIHAYDGAGGSFDFRVTPRANAILITVADDGDGIRPRPASERSSGRLGLLLMAALASRVEISERPGGGTRLSIRFALSNRSR
jgi:anti-sigma regulatory factor (Ser/Thr protein kinase)